jgi:hypothetical protein
LELIRRGRLVVAVDVELVIPVDDPTEPCYESETVRMLEEVADRSDKDGLRERGAFTS